MLVDVSHVVENGMITYKGLPAPLVCDFLSREQSRSHYAPGTEFHIGKIEMVANTGTYLDSPFHRYVIGKDLSELPLDRLANLDGIVIPADLSKGRAIDHSVFQRHDLRHKAVLNPPTCLARCWKSKPFGWWETGRNPAIQSHIGGDSMTPNGLVANKVALVTGAASGIGKSTALLLAKKGAAVVAGAASDGRRWVF
jgi:kynurenine formamidase